MTLSRFCIGLWRRLLRTSLALHIGQTRRKLIFFCALSLFLLLQASGTWASTFKTSDVPEPLKTWIPWAVDGDDRFSCPYFFNDGGNRQCAWPGVLDLKLASSGGQFSQDWQVAREAWISLPGDEKNWPQETMVDGKAAPVTLRDGVPSLKLVAGLHRVTGRFVLQTLPESLALPTNAALLRLEVNGQAVALPVRDEENRLWLQRKADAEGEEQVQVQLFRKIIDGVPVQLETRIQLVVSGKGRELVIPAALLEGFIPKVLQSTLPSALNADGSLKVQVRAGNWDISLIARHPSAVTSISLPKLAAGKETIKTDPSAREEVWVFEANPLVRSASIIDGLSVDPQQTNLPQEWRALPAFLVKPAMGLTIKEIRRGDSNPAPDKLALDRRMWLSFDGTTITMNDRIQGEISSSNRFTIAPFAQLGRADINGRDQLITRGDDQLVGLEVKRGTLALGADSILKNAPRQFPAVAWQRDFDRVSAELNLPAGWRLFHAGGVDKAEGAWIAQWNLLDFFIVLIIAIAAAQLWGRTWGVVALLLLALTYQEPNAPQFAWVVVLALVAIVRALPDGKLRRAVRLAQCASLLGLIALCLSFATQQLRGALYPVLEQGGNLQITQFRNDPQDRFKVEADLPVAETQIAEVAPAPAPAAPIAQAPQPMIANDERSFKGKVDLEKKFQRVEVTGSRLLPDISNPYSLYKNVDPDAKVQTGPGLPNWRWHAYRLVWDGPVRQNQELSLWLIAPWLNKVLVLLQLLCMGFFVWRMVGVTSLPNKRTPDQGENDGKYGNREANNDGATPLKKSGLFGFLKRDKNKLVSLCLCAVLAGISLSISHPAHAQLPSPEQLKELKEKLSRPPECLPECADIAKLSVQIVGNTVRLGLDVDAAIETALPLPGGAKSWLPKEALLDGKAAYVHRDENQTLWLLSPAGRHRVELIGELSSRDSLLLPLPRKPRRVEINALGWDVAGLSEESGAAEALQLSRRVKAAGGLEAPVLPPFLRVERRLMLDLVWRVETTVWRDSPLGIPALAQIPLLPGEAVTTAGVIVKDGKVQLNLGAQADKQTWTSTLSQTPELTLLAAKESAWAETWVVVASTIWHVDAQGLPPVAAQARQAADQVFMPWPGETLQLKICRPKPVEGQTLTIDRSILSIKPGARATDYVLQMQVRSSRGADQKVSLPDGAVVQRVSIGGQVRPIRATGRELVLPLTPGAQAIEIAWRTEQGMSMNFVSAMVDLHTPTVNHQIDLTLPSDRWLLAMGGAGVGPAILFWSKLLILLGVAVGIGRFSGLPFKTSQWCLLALGLTQVEWWAALLVFSWFFAFSFRTKFAAGEGAKRWFNLRQVALIFMTLILLSILFMAVQGGLLGQPEMQVVGNNSAGHFLRWYSDRTEAALPTVWTLTLPILAYRGLMLLWAVWLAWSLLRWLKWGWQAFSLEGLWLRREKPTDEAVDGAENNHQVLSSTFEDATQAEQASQAEHPPKQ